jgi:FkbM family methyltransferase
MVVQCTELIEAPPGFVFQVLHDYRLRLDWDPFLRRAELLDGATSAAVGVKTRCCAKYRLLGWCMTTEYVNFQPGEVAAVKMTLGPFFFDSFAASIRHRSHESGSETLYRLNFRLRRGFPAFLTSLVSRCLEWETTRRLKALKRFCEGDRKTQLKQVEVEPGLRVFCNSTEEAKFIHREVFEEDSYLAALPHLGSSPLVVDVGSNIGLFALHLLNRYPDAKLLCMEPSPESFKALRKNLARKPASLRRLAAGSKPGLLSFYYYPLAPGNSSLYPRQLTTELIDKLHLAFKVTFNVWWKPLITRPVFGWIARAIWGKPHITVVEVLKLSSLLTEYPENIDLLKIDVERAELDVLEGIDQADWHRIRHIAVEVTSLDWGHGHLERVVGLLEDKGYDVTVEENELNRKARLAIEEQLETEGRIDHLVFASRPQRSDIVS